MTDDHNNWANPFNDSRNESHDDAPQSVHNDSEPTQNITIASSTPDTSNTQEQPTQTIEVAPVTDDDKNDDAASGATAADSQSTQSYRLAPQFGAYGQVPEQTKPQDPVQDTTPQQPVNTSAYPFGMGNLFGVGNGAPQNQQQQRPTYGSPTGGQQQGAHNAAPNPFGNPNPQQGAQQNSAQGTHNPYLNVAGGAGTSGPNAGPGNGQYPGGGNPFNMPQRPVAKTPSNIIVAVVAALVSAAICLGVGYAAITNGWVTGPNSTSIAGLSSRKSGSGSAVVEGGETPDWPAVSNAVSMAVVSIQTQIDNNSGAQGSGAILDQEGHIITNNHVVSGAQKIQVTLDNGDIYSAQVVGTDKTTDLAVIKLDNPPKDLKTIEFADSNDLTPGEPVMAIGNPLGYDGTATTGIVSALNRPVSVMDDDNTEIVTNAVQIDAAVNPGNSGGPTFNAAGKVIGINSSIATTATSSSSAGSIGIGFAIPANLAKRVAEEIIKDGKVEHVALGVSITSATVEADGVTRGGAEVKSVVAGSPAAQAGVKAGDTIVAFDGVGVNNNYSLLGFVRAAALNSTAKLTVVRDGKSLELDVKFDQAENKVNGNNREESQNNNGDNNNNNNNDQNQPEQRNPNKEDEDSRGGFTDPFGLW